MNEEGVSREGIDSEFHKSIARLVLDYAKVAYVDFLETWRDIERKAQGTVAIAGIFVAGAFGLLRSWESQPGIATAGLTGVIVLFTLAILFALFALAVTRCPSLKDSELVLVQADIVLGACDNAEAKGKIRKFVRTVAEDFNKTSNEIHLKNSTKSAWVGRAQLCLGVGVFLAAALMIGTLYGNW